MLARRKPFQVLLLAAVAAAIGVGPVRGQVPGQLPPAPLPALAAPPAPPPPSSPITPNWSQPVPVPYVPPAPSPFLTPGPSGGPLAAVPPPPAPLFPTGDPGATGWGPYDVPSQQPGLYFDIQLQFTQPSLKNRINPDHPFGASGAFTVPSGDLDWTVSPTFELGHRLPDCLGFFALSYRFLVSEGNETQLLGGTPYEVRTRLNLNTFDLDYGTAPLEFAPRYDLSYRIGARLSDIFFDSLAQGPAFSRQGSNKFTGAGPHAQIDLQRHIAALPGLALFGRLDGSVLVGQIHQRFREDDLGGMVTTFSDTRTRSQSVPTLALQLGLSYTPSFARNLHFTTGYQYEHYWFLGQIGEDASGQMSASRGELSAHSWFLRGRLDF